MLGRRCGLDIQPARDLYVSLVGGASFDEPALDLAVALALASTARDVGIGPGYGGLRRSVPAGFPATRPGPRTTSSRGGPAGFSPRPSCPLVMTASSCVQRDGPGATVHRSCGSWRFATLRAGIRTRSNLGWSGTFGVGCWLGLPLVASGQDAHASCDCWGAASGLILAIALDRLPQRRWTVRPSTGPWQGTLLLICLVGWPGSWRATRSYRISRWCPRAADDRVGELSTGEFVTAILGLTLGL